MPQKALITGASGLLGRAVLRVFKESGWQAVGTGFSRAKPPDIVKLDLGDETAITALLDEQSPGAANRFPDKVEADPEAARAVNVHATKALAAAAAARDILVIYISTDYVFSGKRGEAPYEADTAPSPTNLYGQTKLDGERATLEATATGQWGVVLRVPVLYGHATTASESSVNTLVNSVYKSQTATVDVDDWSQRYPTNVEDVGRVCADIASKYLAQGSEGRHGLPSILQFSSEDRMTKFQMCELFAELLALPTAGLHKQGPDPKAAVQRPYDTHLSRKALQSLGIAVGTQNFKDWWTREMGAYRH